METNELRALIAGQVVTGIVEAMAPVFAEAANNPLAASQLRQRAAEESVRVADAVLCASGIDPSISKIPDALRDVGPASTKVKP